MTAIVLYLFHHPLLVGVSTVARALWKGARTEVVRFGQDISVLVFARLRRLLRLTP